MSLRKWLKGWGGEAQSAFANWLLLDKNIYHRLNNITLPTSNGTTQIDHIIVSRYGIFVIETKNMEGWIFGSVTQKEWTQRFASGQTFRFQNPLHQNHRHIMVLSEYLSLPKEHFHSVVMFWGQAQFKSTVPENVMNHGYITYIKNKTDVILNDQAVSEIVTAINEGRKPKSFQTSREHVESLKQRYDSTTICPKCGGQLIERIAKSGSNAGNRFYGCDQYPKCRYTKNIE